MFTKMLPRSLARPSLRLTLASKTTPIQPRPFSTSPPLRDNSTLPAKKPVGAFRGGLFGFLSGALAAGGVVYYYILGEYRISNEMLTEDIFALQKATQKLQTYIIELEGKVDQVQSRKK